MCMFYLLQEWAEGLFSLASNLLVQNMSREACLEKAYVISTHKQQSYIIQSHAKCKFSIFKINVKIGPPNTKKPSLITGVTSAICCILQKQKQKKQMKRMKDFVLHNTTTHDACLLTNAPTDAHFCTRNILYPARHTNTAVRVYSGCAVRRHCTL